MKCDHIRTRAQGDTPFFPNMLNNANVEVCLKEDVDKAIAELKQKLDEKESWVKMLGEGEAALSLELEKTKQKLENVQASMYADVVDANMDNRRLKRALWLERARRAEARKDYWYARSCHEGDDFLVSIDGSHVKYIGCIKRTNYDWLLTWSEVERKCGAKAEEYK